MVFLSLGAQPNVHSHTDWPPSCCYTLQHPSDKLHSFRNHIQQNTHGQLCSLALDCAADRRNVFETVISRVNPNYISPAQYHSPALSICMYTIHATPSSGSPPHSHLLDKCRTALKSTDKPVIIANTDLFTLRFQQFAKSIQELGSSSQDALVRLFQAQ